MESPAKSQDRVSSDGVESLRKIRVEEDDELVEVISEEKKASDGRADQDN